MKPHFFCKDARAAAAIGALGLLQIAAALPLTGTGKGQPSQATAIAEGTGLALIGGAVVLLLMFLIIYGIWECVHNRFNKPKGPTYS